MLETKTAPFTFIKNGIFYFPRRGPDELKHHYTALLIHYAQGQFSSPDPAHKGQRNNLTNTGTTCA